MTPIELNGKVFCSNCGLTIANNSPEPTTNTISPTPETVSNVATNVPEEVQFPVIPEIALADENKSTANETAGFYTNQPSEVEEPTQEKIEEVIEAPVARKLEIITDDESPQTESWAPITAEIAKDLGVSNTETTDNEPVFESKISDLSIPSEEDFSEITTDHEPVSSYVELANPGNEKETLEASGILLDILGNENNQPQTEPDTGSQKSEAILNPIAEPEIPAETETKEEDDIYTIPSEIKVGLRNKKVTKKHNTKEITQKPEEVDPKTEKKIEKLEELIADTPEPTISLTAEEAKDYDPDTIDIKDINPTVEKSKIIKDYFSTAIEKDKKVKKKKSKKKKRKQSFKIIKIIISSILIFCIFAVGVYFAYDYFKPARAVQQSVEMSRFTTITPTYIPEGYLLKNSDYFDSDKTFQVSYIFANDKSKMITYRQIQVDNTGKFISDYILAENASFIEKTVGDLTITEVNKNNLVWAKDEFVFIIETENYDLSNELLYKIAETVK